ncbi:putative bifunctional diguanylate cyclase/phosphodiesterase [Pararobbsia silviterrae]|uniref:putative bifunctional diguanylate cyclase/phosphodiesterase n=1 Tax=Pararobbsia silviterrae TaxID=1792498 RepID=UPI001F0C0C2B|nr:GGDEF domain-containing protein [Pararobbsia silviterrae]
MNDRAVPGPVPVSADASRPESRPAAASHAAPSADASPSSLAGLFRAVSRLAPFGGRESATPPVARRMGGRIGDEDIVETRSHAPYVLGEHTVEGIDFLAQVDLDLRFTYISEAGLRFMGYHRAFLEATSLTALVPDADAPLLSDAIAQARESAEPIGCTLRMNKSLTYPGWVNLRVAPLREDNALVGFAISASDISAWAIRQERLRFEAEHDALTGLDNLVSIQRRLQRVFADASRGDVRVALLSIDLDAFQRINNALGYEAGDMMLKLTAERLMASVDPDDIVARTGSDEFVVMSRRSADARSSETLARRLIAAISQPYSYEGQSLHIAASIGIALSEQVGSDERQLLRGADQALYRAKRLGGNTLMFFVDQRDPEAADKLKLEAELYEGVRNGEFSLHYQPIARIDSRNVVGVEALMRWHHPKRGLVPPSTFIPLAEAVGLINYLGAWALKTACMQLALWDSLGMRLEYVAVNVSAQQFREAGFAATVRETLQLTGIEPHRLVLEITESVLMHDPQRARVLLEALAEIGIRFAVDDFGTGYSSLAYLQRFPLTELKIDRSFVENLSESRNDQAIVTAVAALAKTLNLRLVAEGVETEAQRSLLIRLGCGHIQGWLLCKALPAHELQEKFRSHALAIHDVHGK